MLILAAPVDKNGRSNPASFHKELDRANIYVWQKKETFLIIV